MKKLLVLTFGLLLSLQVLSDNGRTVAIFDCTTRNNETSDAELYAVKHVLKVSGIPFIVTSDVNVAIQYPVILSSSKIQGSTLTTPEADSLISFVNAGGTLVVPNVTDSYLYPLFGISGQLQLPTRHRLTFNTSLGDPSMRWLNDTLEQTISLGSLTIDTVIASRAFTVTTANVFATFDDGTPAITRNLYGSGKAYALGVSYKFMIEYPQLNLDFEAQRTYSNGFEPTSDAWILFVKGICISKIPNSVWLHTSPYDSKSSLLITHDIDAQTSYDTMHYYADYEHSIGTSAFYFCTTHYLSDGCMSAYFNPADVLKIQYVMGQGHKIGSHSVGHFPDFDNGTVAPMGVLGNTTTNYLPYNAGGGVATVGSTALGETELSKSLLESNLGITVRSFRAGYLCFNPYLVRALDSVGYSYNSTNAANDLLTNFPFVNHKYKHSYSPLGNVWELPMTLSDVFHDDPITASNYLQKEAIWLDVVTRNTQNYAPTVLLIHPTRYYKLFAEQQLINQLPPKVALVNFETFADYWVARNNVSFTTSLLNDTLTVIVPNSLLPLNDQISFVVDDGQSLLFIKVQDDLGNPIASIQSNWDNNGILVHFGYANTGINENNGAGENDITASCFPNPFSNTTTVEVWQKENCNLNVTLYNIYGQVVKTLVNEKRTPGIYRDQLDASDISGGIYFCKIISGNKSVVKKLLIINK